jgi:ribosomal protein S18 acetylase RimI-like enzyme
MRRPRERWRVSIEVRLAQPDDDAFISALGSACAATSISKVRPVPDGVAALSFQRLLTFCRERPGTVDFIAALDDVRVGFLILLTDIPDDVTQEDQAFVAYMAVALDARRRGVGRALIAAAESEASRLALPHLSMMVTADNTPARALYARLGLTEERILMTKAVSKGADP